MAKIRRSKTNTTNFMDIPADNKGKKHKQQDTGVVVVRGYGQPRKCPTCKSYCLEGQGQDWECVSCNQKILFKDEGDN